MAADHTHSDDSKASAPDLAAESASEASLASDATTHANPPPTNPSPVNLSAEETERPSRIAGSNLLAVLLSLVAIGISSWLGYRFSQPSPQQPSSQAGATLDQRLESLLAQQRQRQQQVEQRLLDLEAGLNKLNQTRQQRMAALSAQQETVQQDALRRLQQLEEQQQALAQAVGQRRQAPSKEWRLNEIEFLLRLAAEQVAIAEDPKRAATALKAALNLLIALDIPAYQPVLEAINQSLLALEQLPAQASGPIHAQLLAIQQTLSSTPRLEPQTPAQTDDKDKASLDKANTGWAWLKARISQAFIIETTDTPKRLLLTPSAHRLAVSQSLLLLEQTQTALLLKDNEWYQSSLTQAQQSIAQLTGLQIEPILNRLQALQQINLERELPDLSPPLNLFISVREQQQQGTQARVL